MRLERAQFVEGSYKCHNDCPIKSVWKECPFLWLYDNGGICRENICNYSSFINFMAVDKCEGCKQELTEDTTVALVDVDVCQDCAEELIEEAQDEGILPRD